MNFQLPELDYDFDALEPYIDKETMERHYNGHHQAYITNLIKQIKNTDNYEMDLMKYLSFPSGPHNIKLSVKRKLKNFAGGHYNHSLFWKCMCPAGKSDPIDQDLLNLINRSFGSYDAMVQEFNKTAVELFGSGWVWLCYFTGDQTLVIRTTKDQDTVYMKTKRLVPLLGLDVWEHAYYLKHRGNRAQYANDWWKIVNWTFVNKVFKEFALQNKMVCVENDGSIIF